MKLVDLRGRRFGKLIVEDRVPTKKRTKWRCLCDCGRRTEVYAQNLITSNTTTCGCSGRGRNSKIDLTGQKFGLLTVVSQHQADGRGTEWNCLCDCGRTVVRNGHAMRAGDVKTCGCGSHPLKYQDPSRAAFNELFAQYKKNARRAGRAFELTEEEFRQLTSGCCYLCGASPAQLGCYRVRGASTNTEPYLANGIDRVSNDEGYTLSNCVPCCKRCNWMKADLSVEEFLLHVKKIRDHFALPPPLSGIHPFRPALPG